MVTASSKKPGERGKSKKRKDPENAKGHIRGPYMRREERRALLEADPYCRVLNKVAVWCIPCNKLFKLDCRPKSLSASTGGYYGSNWRKHRLTHLKLEEIPHDGKFTKAIESENETEYLTGQSPKSLFLPDSDSDSDPVNGSGHEIKFDLGSWKSSDSTHNMATEPTASSTDDLALDLEDNQSKQTSVMNCDETFAEFYATHTDSGCASLEDPRRKEFTHEHLASAKVNVEDEQVAAARILVNLSRAHCGNRETHFSYTIE